MESLLQTPTPTAIYVVSLFPQTLRRSVRLSLGPFWVTSVFFFFSFRRPFLETGFVMYYERRRTRVIVGLKRRTHKMESLREQVRKCYLLRRTLERQKVFEGGTGTYSTYMSLVPL